MIEISLNNLLTSVDTLKSLTGKSYPAKVAYQIARICREVQNECNLFDEQRNNLIRKYCNYDEDGEIKKNEQGFIDFTPENQTQFEGEITQLLATTINLNVEPVELEAFGEATFTPDQMLLIEPFVK